MANTFALPDLELRPALHKFGAAQTPVVVIDNFCSDLEPIIAAAAALAPFPPAGNHYPGVRRVIQPTDTAYAYIEDLLERAAPFVGGAFDVDRFELVEASFSVVTCPPERLSPVQRTPHFDATDGGYFAVMHYLSETAGTAFYRHRATATERVTNAGLNAYIAAAQRESARTTASYIVDSNEYYECIGAVTGCPNRLVIYPGNLLHSGIILPEARLSSDPRQGRLTTNIFIRAT